MAINDGKTLENPQTVLDAHENGVTIGNVNERGITETSLQFRRNSGIGGGDVADVEVNTSPRTKENESEDSLMILGVRIEYVHKPPSTNDVQRFKELVVSIKMQHRQERSA